MLQSQVFPLESWKTLLEDQVEKREVKIVLLEDLFFELEVLNPNSMTLY